MGYLKQVEPHYKKLLLIFHYQINQKTRQFFFPLIYFGQVKILQKNKLQPLAPVKMTIRSVHVAISALETRH